MPQYTVKNVKFFNSRNGYGFNATLYRDGKKIANVIEEGNGGQLRLLEFAQAEADILKAYCATLPKMEFAGKVLDTSIGMFVESLVLDADLLKKLKAKLRKGIVFVAGESMYMNSAPFTAINAAAVKAKWPGAVVLNEKVETEAFDLFKRYGTRGS